jgi:hypothetical protein
MTDASTRQENSAGIALKIPAQIFSILFHPLFIPVYLTLYLMFIEQTSFLSFTDQGRMFILIHVIVFPCLFPAFATFLLYKLNFIESLYLRTQKERIIPYMISMIFFFWSFLLFKNKTEWPQAMTQLYLGIFICVSMAVIFNNFFKISMHSMGVGGALGFLLILLFNGLLSFFLPLIIAVALCGIVCSARLLLNSHRPFEVYAGLIVGLISQLIASRFVDLRF